MCEQPKGGVGKGGMEMVGDLGVGVGFTWAAESDRDAHRSRDEVRVSCTGGWLLTSSSLNEYVCSSFHLLKGRSTGKIKSFTKVDSI